MSFENLNLITPILEAIKTEGYTTPTPIQKQAIPVILQKRDLLGCAQTGTGKTAAFAIPLLQQLSEDRRSRKFPPVIRTLVLTPTRELAIQISESFTRYGKKTGIRQTVIFGGVPQKAQTDALARGVHILIATPGRLLDLMEQKYVDLKNIEHFVLDEADRMLDMGFIHDVKKIIAALPKNRQTLFFSATMPPAIAALADSILTNPERITVTPVSSTVDSISQYLYFVDRKDKKLLLLHLLQDPSILTALVFTRTKYVADKIAKDLVKKGIRAEAIHGDKSQNARQRALSNFKTRRTRVLVATDIAARGIDVEELSHVINFDLPSVPETYVHRIGRTGRAGLSGIALSFCDRDEKTNLADIHSLISRKLKVVEDHPYPLQETTPVPEQTVPVKKVAGKRQVRNTRSASPGKKSASRRPVKKQEGR